MMQISRPQQQSLLLWVAVMATLVQSSRAFSSTSTISSYSAITIRSTTRTTSKGRHWKVQPSSPKIQEKTVFSLRTKLHQSVIPEQEQLSKVDDSVLASIQKALDQGNLKQAVESLKLADADQVNMTRSLWNQIFDVIEERTANAEENTENLRAGAAAAATEFPVISAARSEMTEMYDTLKCKGQLRLYGALDPRQPLAAGSKEIPPPLLEGILDLPMRALTPQPTNSLVWAGAAVAVAEGFASLALGIPMTTLVLLTLFVVTCDRIFLGGASFETFLKFFSPGVQDKILRHEAGHFLAAYLLGCPVEGIVLSAWAALKDRRFGGRSVSAGTSFFDPQLSEQINKRQSVTQSAVDRYSIIVMAGIAAEADGYGRADGGAGDEMSLVAFLSQLNNSNGRGGKTKTTTTTTVWTNDSIRNQARWGALQAVLMLREYRPAYDALVDALERGGTLGECIFAIEQAARQHNLPTTARPLGYVVEETVPEGKRLVWKKLVSPSSSNGDQPMSDSMADVSINGSATSTLNDDNTAMESGRASKASLESPSLQDEEEAMGITLQHYRAQVEAKLKEVEQKLRELEQKQ